MTTPFSAMLWSEADLDQSHRENEALYHWVKTSLPGIPAQRKLIRDALRQMQGAVEPQ